MKVDRACHDEKYGYFVRIRSGKKQIDVRCSPGGNMLDAVLTEGVGEIAGDGDPRPQWLKEKAD